ncbi:glycoside hydrolase family 15 protein [Gemmata sp. JC673]|uniref:Glycoside hydrolase family 15 protein n=1 Tax=Gemmata algarum TaxID=2975278 RepID=A0ABU5EUE0_9BACT|nr:glycoside hydrolase family 15 protein [Gemmata algarum]MDY3558077.1 glycoside hydrolase family 15 protein [Gemmata algarum]
MADAPEHIREAPGRPGSPPRWCTGGKTAGGTSRSDASLVWFTIHRGVLNEVYYPRIDSPCTRDLYLIVTGPEGFCSDEREDAEHTVEWIGEGVPGFTVATACKKGRYRIEKTVITDDRLNVVLQRVRFTRFPAGHRVFVYANPHLAAHGSGNTAWVGRYKGQTALFAERGDVALALLCSAGYSTASVGFAGKSDGPDDLKKHGRLTERFTRAAQGNVGLVGEIDLSHGPEFTLALGFGLGPGEAAYHASGGLKRDFPEAVERYADGWRAWQDKLLPLAGPGRDLYRVSTAVLESHTNKSIPGAVASLAIPWGDARGDDDLLQGAYHLVWSRDLGQHGSGLLAIGALQDARRLLEYLQATQEPDGHWPQNMWVSGEPFWDGVQVDQAAQPILLTDHALRAGAIDEGHRARFWPMLRAAVGYIVRNGASTELDRWEEEKGYNPYTLATMIAALLAAADWADAASEPELATYLRETADVWDAGIEGWVYVRGTELAKKVGVDGYYARILPPGSIEPAYPGQECARLKDADAGEQDVPGHEVASVDALALVRYGLRAADDPKILNTLKVIDAELKMETERGPIWHRYTADRFGEHDDGSAFEPGNKGKGRAWPLLIGERAHHELARGERTRATELVAAMANYAGDAGLISEQVWDADDLPEKWLFKGRPTGSAAPLLWAHAEYLKVLRSLKDGRVFDRPPQPEARYAGGRRKGARALWRVEHPVRSVPAGTVVRIEAVEGVEVRWRVGRGAEQVLAEAPTFLGVRVADVPALAEGTTVNITATRPGDDGSQVREEHTVTVR